jgi:hypothetical protein
LCSTPWAPIIIRNENCDQLMKILKYKAIKRSCQSFELEFFGPYHIQQKVIIRWRKKMKAAKRKARNVEEGRGIQQTVITSGIRGAEEGWEKS